VLLRHADTLRVGAPHRQRADTVSLSQPRAARAGRERRLVLGTIGDDWHAQLKLITQAATLLD
jgi:hypothetical protein